MTGIARLCNLPLEKVEQAFHKFQSPDPKSSSQEFEGRRIEKVDDGWKILNHEKYAEIGWSEDKKERERKRKSDYRSRIKDNPEILELISDSKIPESAAASILRKLDSSVTIPPVLLASVEFLVWWKKWLEHLGDKRCKPSINAQQMQLSKLDKMGLERAIAALKYSIESNWRGVYEPRNNQQSDGSDGSNGSSVKDYL